MMDMSTPVSQGLPKLIGIHGHARAGKDTAANFFASTYKDHYIESFAAPLKDACSVAFGIYRAYFDEPGHKHVILEDFGKSPREILQFVGTELFRNTYGEHMWVQRMERRLSNQYLPDEEGEYLPEHTVVIPDVRFQNEYDWIIANGGIVIHLIRPGADGAVGIPGHASEATLNLHAKEKTYQVINDGTIPELEIKIANVIMATKY